jgi:pre-mRNA-processing factor 6
VQLTLAQEKREDVIAKCVVSAPKHGEVWQGVAKDPKHARLGTEEILKLVVDKLE